MKQCEQCKKDLKTKEQIKLKVLISGLNPVFCSWECLSLYCGVMLNIEDGFDEENVK